MNNYVRLVKQVVVQKRHNFAAGIQEKEIPISTLFF